MFDKMKKYVKPSVKVKQMEIDAILAASNPSSAPAAEFLDDENVINDASMIEAKAHSNVSCWDE